MSTETFSSNPSQPNNFQPETGGVLGSGGEYVGIPEAMVQDTSSKTLDSSVTVPLSSRGEELGGLTSGSTLSAGTETDIYEQITGGIATVFPGLRTNNNFSVDSGLVYDPGTAGRTFSNDMAYLESVVSFGEAKTTDNNFAGDMPEGSALNLEMIISDAAGKTVADSAYSKITNFDDWRLSLNSGGSESDFQTETVGSLQNSPTGVMSNEDMKLGGLASYQEYTIDQGTYDASGLSMGVDNISLEVGAVAMAPKTVSSPTFQVQATTEFPIVETVTVEDYIRISRMRDNMLRDSRMISVEDLIASINFQDGIDGLSAYQIAVNNGFIGNEAQWIASLEGPAGPNVYIDTLQSVTTRGATTTLPITTGGLIAPQILDETSVLSIGINNRTLNNSTGTIIINWENGYFNASDGNLSIDATQRKLTDSFSIQSMDWQARQLRDASDNVSIDYANGMLSGGGLPSLSWTSREFYDSSGMTTLSWTNRQFYNSSGQVVYDWNAGFFYIHTGSPHVIVDMGTQTLYDIVDQSAYNWRLRVLYASDGGTVLMNHNNATGARFRPIQVGRTALDLAPTATIHVDAGNGIASATKFTAGTTTGTTTTDGFDVGITNTGIAEIRQREALGLNFYTSNTLALTIASTGISSFLASVDFRAGTATANTYPCKFTSGALLSVAVAGVQEFLTDKVYTTITTGLARKEYTLNDVALTSGKLPIVTTNGRLTNSTASGYVKVTAGTVSSTTIIPSSEGGTGLSSGAPGDILQHNGTIWTQLSAVSSGSYLRSTGTNAALVWSTLKLPNTLAIKSIPYASTANNLGESTNFTFDGANFGLFASSGTLSVYHQGTGTQTVPTADFATSITLTNTSSLVQNYTGVGGHTLTLTTCSTGFLAGAGIQFIIKNVGTGVLTVNRASTDTMFVFSAVTTMTINIGECYTFQCRSAGQWSVY